MIEIKEGDLITIRTGTYPVIKNDDGLIWYKCPSGQGQTISEFVTAVNKVKVDRPNQFINFLTDL